MNALVCVQIEFPAAKRRAFEVLAVMKWRLDKYREKIPLKSDQETEAETQERENKEKWVEERESELAILVELVNVAEKTINMVESEGSEEFNRGFAKGMQKQKNIFENGHLHKHFDREQFRASHNNNQYQKWGDHF